MGLEDYIRARSDQYYAPSTRDVRIHSPQRQRTPIFDKSLSGNGVPSSRFMRPLMPFQFQEAEIITEQSQQYELPAQQQPQEKSIFDTDIENADDTTITVTSLADIGSRDHGGRGIFDHDDISQDWDASVLSESDHQTDGNNYYRAEDPTKVASAASKYRRKTVVPLAAAEEISYANGYKDNVRREQLDWNPAEIPRSATASSNKRNSIANVSRIPRAKSRMSLQRSDSDPGLRSGITTAKEPTTNTRTVQIPYRTGYSRTSNFPQSLATTPNNRFNFKSERSYERLISQQASPTRRVSGPRPQPNSRHQRQRQEQQRRCVQTRKKHESASSSRVKRLLDDSDLSFDDEEDEQETENISEDIGNESSGSSVNAQSLTTTDVTQRKISISTTSESIDRRYQKLTSDYPDEVLQQMDFSELEKEPFDHSPTSSSPLENHRKGTATTTPKKLKAPSPPPSPHPPPDTATTPSEKLAYIMNALPNPTARHQYISTMNITDWESLGDELLDQMSEMLKMIKESRQARRRTTALFEAEIRRRHDQTMSETRELDRKFGEMKEGGLGVLRALKP
ncbi:conserved hypothetical protein [Talaromyces stipitatus ATCC 10500]|uniref:Extracellular mutant protein 11 C-terminal domain-containing protein n=1 Tax=Talaromyces stipitatus (strain ATCC 10500 / CBS 375.48 / QM 6759 / NRRL 1006) TaxID=441959 RepID=B8M8N5_TALSN|nr:uncharacterized protein TSTA_037660 [Talaromyces stipitatus ATCC 10500]EED20548.1 conserved hypothetical protein [Talaromyces stipitatus ATCC 10500]